MNYCKLDRLDRSYQLVWVRNELPLYILPELIRHS